MLKSILLSSLLLTSNLSTTTTPPYHVSQMFDKSNDVTFARPAYTGYQNYYLKQNTSETQLQIMEFNNCHWDSVGVVANVNEGYWRIIGLLNNNLIIYGTSYGDGSDLKRTNILFFNFNDNTWHQYNLQDTTHSVFDQGGSTGFIGSNYIKLICMDIKTRSLYASQFTFDFVGYTVKTVFHALDDSNFYSYHFLSEGFMITQSNTQLKLRVINWGTGRLINATDQNQVFNTAAHQIIMYAPDKFIIFDNGGGTIRFFQWQDNDTQLLNTINLTDTTISYGFNLTTQETPIGEYRTLIGDEVEAKHNGSNCGVWIDTLTYTYGLINSDGSLYFNSRSVCVIDNSTVCVVNAMNIDIHKINDAGVECAIYQNFCPRQDDFKSSKNGGWRIDSPDILTYGDYQDGIKRSFVNESFDINSLHFDPQITATNKVKVFKNSENGNSFYYSANGSVDLSQKIDGIASLTIDDQNVKSQKGAFAGIIENEGIHTVTITTQSHRTLNGTVEICEHPLSAQLVDHDSKIPAPTLPTLKDGVVIDAYDETNSLDMIEFNDPVILNGGEVILQKCNDDWSGTSEQHTIAAGDTTWTYGDGKFTLSTTDEFQDQTVSFIQWNGVAPLINFWTTGQGQDLKKRAQYHDPKEYNDDTLNEMKAAEINKLIIGAKNWNIPTPINPGPIAISTVVGIVFACVSVVGLPFGVFYLNKYLRIKKKNRSDKKSIDRQKVIDGEKIDETQQPPTLE